MTKTGVLILVISLLLVADQAMASVPELDPGAASTGVALLVGGLVAFLGRRRNR